MLIAFSKRIRAFLTGFAFLLAASPSQATEAPTPIAQSSQYGLGLSLGFVALGFSVTKNIEPGRDLILLCEKEGFPIVGYWSQVLVGVRHFISDSLYLRLTGGLGNRQEWADKGSQDLVFSGLLGWQQELTAGYFWGFEMVGLAMRLKNIGINTYMHIPKVTLSYQF